MSISMGDFAKLEMKVGRIATVDEIPQARKPMYKLTIDLGNSVTKQCVGGIKPYYAKEGLLGRLVVVVVNLEPKSVAGVVSECMMLAAFDENTVSLLMPDKSMPVGTKVG